MAPTLGIVVGTGARCAEPGCDAPPAWVRGRATTWCDAHLAGLAAACGYTPAEPLADPKQRWLVVHDACGTPRHVSFASIRKAVTTARAEPPVCGRCRWTEWARWVRTQVQPAWDRAGLPGPAHAEWTVQRQRAAFDACEGEPLEELHDGDGLDPVLWRCRNCGRIDCQPPERLSPEARWKECADCNNARLYNDLLRVRGSFTTRGLELLQDYPGDRDAPLVARCLRCGAPRTISLHQLTTGVLPCLGCDGTLLDPTAPHRVYLFHFPQLHAYKVGITHARDDGRLQQHRSAGGILIDTVPTPNRAVALVLERDVLDRYRAHPADVLPTDFPHGGWTECWNELAGYPDLHDVMQGHRQLYEA